MLKDLAEKAGKRPPVTRRGILGAQAQPRPNAGTSSGRTPSPADSNHAQLDLINTARGGRNFLESRLLLVPEGAPVTSANLSAALFQISAIAKVPREAIQAIHSVAWLLDEMEEDTVAAMARDAMNAQLGYMNEELRLLTDHFRTTLSTEVDKQMEIMSVTTKTLEARIGNPAPYRDAVLGNTKAPEGADPRVVA